MGMKVLLAAAVLVLGSSVAHSTTINFDGVSGGLNADLGDGFIAEDIRIVSGGCAANNCAALNTNGPVGGRLDEMTIRKSDFSAFSISSFWYQRLGLPAIVTVVTSAGAMLTFDALNSNHNDGTVVDTSLVSLFQNIVSITFDNGGTGNIRIDDIEVVADITNNNPPSVPLPAAGWMLLAGVGGLAALKRRNKS